MSKNCLAFDQSYSRIGYSVYDLEKNELKEYGSFKLKNFPDKVVKRAFIWGLAKGLNLVYNPTIVVCEQIRLKNKFGINIDTIKSLTEITSRIVDAVYPKEVFTVDSKSWKAKVIGDGSADKQAAINYVAKKFNVAVDDDCADAICMSMYPNSNKPILNLY